MRDRSLSSDSDSTSEREGRAELDAEALVNYGRLKPEDEGNREKIAEAVEALVDQFTEGRLVPARDG